MKSTGKINPITGMEIMQVEEHDIEWTEKEWEDLTDNEKADFLSFRGIPFLNHMNEHLVKEWYEYFRDKNIMEL